MGNPSEEQQGGCSLFTYRDPASKLWSALRLHALLRVLLTPESSDVAQKAADVQRAICGRQTHESGDGNRLRSASEGGFFIARSCRYMSPGVTALKHRVDQEKGLPKLA